MQIYKIINSASQKLKNNNIHSCRLDSEILLSKVLNKTREELLINLNQKIDRSKINYFKKLIDRRLTREPIAYILKEKEFWSKNFLVNNNTLIPRPETELLVDKLLNIYKQKKISILDIGTGSGCIIISLLINLRNSNGIGIDISNKAILLAKKNRIIHKLSNRLKLSTQSFDKIYGKKFDLIVSNPPYIPKKDIKNLSEDIKKYEPRMALDGGNDGLDLVKKVIYKSKYILKIKGTLALEIGNEQIKKVSKILIDNNFRIKHVIKDYKNNVRCVLAYYK